MKQVRKQVLEYLARSGKVVSGEDMALELGVTRAAVWKAVRDLRRAGEDIVSSHKGYFLRAKEEMRASSVLRALPQMGWVECHQTIPSTNDRARVLAQEGAPHFSLVVAEAQSQGRGRFSRRFYSPSGTGLYCSLILRPTCDISYLTRLTPLAAVAVADAIVHLTGTEVGVKWVNDLWLGGKKICGILTEGAIDPNGGLAYAVVGIGINVGATAFPQDLATIATDIETQTGVKVPLHKLLCEVLSCLKTRLEELETGAFLATYRRLSVLDGKEVTIYRGGTYLHGVVRGIGENGELILASDGKDIPITSGEIVKM